MNILSIDISRVINKNTSRNLPKDTFIPSQPLFPKKHLKDKLPLYQIDGDHIKINNYVAPEKLNEPNFTKINPFLIEDLIHHKFGSTFDFNPNKILLNNYAYNPNFDDSLNDNGIKNDKNGTFEKNKFLSITSKYMPETVLFEDEYIFKNNYTAKNVLSMSSLSFLNDSSADVVKCKKHLYLADNAYIKQVKVGGGVFLKDNSHVDSIESTKIINDSEHLATIILRNDSFANTIKAKDGVTLKGNSHANMIESKKNVFLDAQTSSKSIMSKNCILKQSSFCKKINAHRVLLDDDSSATEVNAAEGIVINCNAKVDRIISPFVRLTNLSATARCITSDKNLHILGIGTVEKISIKGTKVIIKGQLQLTGKIRFENGRGKVILLKDSNGLFPNITPANVENGEVIHKFKKTLK